MRLYRTDQLGWAGTQADARKLALADGSDGLFAQVEVPTDKAGLIAFLNDAAALPPVRPEQSRPQAEQSKDSSPAVNSLATDDAWETLPLARKLHFAALAMEDAREAIRS